MKAVLLNRITLVLGSIGLYVALLLTLEKALNIQLPCGSGGGCAKVADHPSGLLLGLPVAYFGLFAYVMLSLIAVLRINADASNQKSLTMVALVMSGVGTLFSLYLQFVSFTVIHAFCPYCFTNAVAMTGIFITQILMNRSLKENVAPSEGTATSSGKLYLPAALPVAALLIALIQSTMLQSSLSGVKIVDGKQLIGVDLIPQNAHSFGNPKAPITIIEFADLGCPSCQKMAPMIKEFVEKNDGKVRLVYRHFLIDQHELSPTAAAMSEVASDKSRFWEFARALMAGMDGNEIHEVQPIMDAATAAGLDVKEMVKRIENPKDSVYARIAADRKVADALGVQGTPTFVLVAPGQNPQIMGGKGMKDMMDSGAITRLAEKATAGGGTP